VGLDTLMVCITFRISDGFFFTVETVKKNASETMGWMFIHISSHSSFICIYFFMHYSSTDATLFIPRPFFVHSVSWGCAVGNRFATDTTVLFFRARSVAAALSGALRRSCLAPSSRFRCPRRVFLETLVVFLFRLQ
jgi:hypothetical protein